MDFGLRELPKLLAILAVLIALIASVTGYGINACQHHQLSKQGAAVIAHRATASQADLKAQRAADSAYFFLKGQQYELQRQLDLNSHHAESLPPVLLPVRPPHGE